MGDPDAHRFRAELARGRWQEFHDFLDSTRDWDDRHFYVHQLSDIDGRPEWLDEWVAAWGYSSSLPLLFRGAHGIHWAWRARGLGYAKTVAGDAWAVFRARLVDAERDLAQAAALDPADPTAFARGVHSALGLALGKGEIRTRFEETIPGPGWPPCVSRRESAERDVAGAQVVIGVAQPDRGEPDQHLPVPGGQAPTR